MNMSGIPIDTLLENAVDGVLVVDRSQRVLVFSSGCERITGYSQQDVLGFECKCADITDCQDEQGRSLAGALCPMRSMARGGPDSITQRMRIRRKDGEYTWVETNYTVMRDGDGEVDFVLGVMRDVTHTRAREQDLLGELSELRERVHRLAGEQKAKYGFDNIITKSPAMAPVFDRVRAALANSSSVLICGESGTGKKIIARTIHAHGLQAEGPFIPLNCAALPRNLIEPELFGHVQGAFAGAEQACPGLLRSAEGGTVFLEEVGEMPLETQAKLLRALQDRRVRPVGGTSESPVHVRIIAAISAPPRAAIAGGKLREDLFYRLSVIDIDLPPLCDRQEDIPLLVQSFIEEFNQSGLRQIKHVEPDAWRAMLNYKWPGNIRELSNAVETAFALGEGHTLRLADFPAEVRGDVRREIDADNSETLLLDPFLHRVEREAILRALKAAGGRRNRAAKIMNISRSRLYRRMDALGIDPSSLRT